MSVEATERNHHADDFRGKLEVLEEEKSPLSETGTAQICRRDFAHSSYSPTMAGAEGLCLVRMEVSEKMQQNPIVAAESVYLAPVQGNACKQFTESSQEEEEVWTNSNTIRTSQEAQVNCTKWEETIREPSSPQSELPQRSDESSSAIQEPIQMQEDNMQPDAFTEYDEKEEAERFHQ